MMANILFATLDHGLPTELGRQLNFPTKLSSELSHPGVPRSVESRRGATSNKFRLYSFKSNMTLYGD